MSKRKRGASVKPVGFASAATFEVTTTSWDGSHLHVQPQWDTQPDFDGVYQIRVTFPDGTTRWYSYSKDVGAWNGDNDTESNRPPSGIVGVQGFVRTLSGELVANLDYVTLAA